MRKAGSAAIFSRLFLQKDELVVLAGGKGDLIGALMFLKGQ